MPKLRHPDGHLVSVSHAGMDALLSRGYTEPDDAPPRAPRKPAATPDPAAAVPHPANPDEVADLEKDGPPAESAKKAEWVAYAEAEGVEDAASLTKAELVERFAEGD